VRKGIILSGGLGTRLYPCTEAVSKQLLPVYDKPLIYYPISTLMMAGIRDILIITNMADRYPFGVLLRDGAHLGLNITYAIQDKPRGIAECFLIGDNFIGDDDVALILGDNIFYGNDLIHKLRSANERKDPTLFAYHVADPERFGVLELDKHKNPIRIVEKPTKAPSNYAVTGLYFYDSNVVEYARQLQPSARGELEITDINNLYMQNTNVHIEYLNRGIAWIDAGTFDSLADASTFIASTQKRTGMMISCPEEIAYDNGWIGEKELLAAANKYSKTNYGTYLKSLLA
jgi:glucose-1-phosphate thymidylyltransferase